MRGNARANNLLGDTGDARHHTDSAAKPLARRHKLRLALACLPLSFVAVRSVQRGASGQALIRALRDTGLAELAFAVGLFAGLAIAAG